MSLDRDFDGQVMLIPVLMPIQVVNALNEQAIRHGTSAAEIVNDAIREKLEDLINSEPERRG